MGLGRRTAGDRGGGLSVTGRTSCQWSDLDGESQAQAFFRSAAMYRSAHRGRWERLEALTAELLIVKALVRSFSDHSGNFYPFWRDLLPEATQTSKDPE